jgi:hypothetical protein
LDFYDLARPQALEGAVWSGLGFKRIFCVGKEVRISDPGYPQNRIGGSLCMGVAGEALCSAARSAPLAVMVRDSRIDRKLIETLRSREIILCVSFDGILSSTGLRRTSRIYMTDKLVRYAIKKSVSVCFVTMAASEEMLCSPIQLVKLAELVGAPAEYARRAISETNKGLVYDDQD